ACAGSQWCVSECVGVEDHSGVCWRGWVCSIAVVCVGEDHSGVWMCRITVVCGCGGSQWCVDVEDHSGVWMCRITVVCGCGGSQWCVLDVSGCGGSQWCVSACAVPVLVCVSACAGVCQCLCWCVSVPVLV